MNKMQEKVERSLENAMGKGFMVFSYMKKDGTLRKAVGTRNLGIIFRISDWRPAGGSENASTLNYFDLVENDWRSFRRGSLVEVFNIGDGVMGETPCGLAIREAMRICLDLNYINRVSELANMLMFKPEVDEFAHLAIGFEKSPIFERNVKLPKNCGFLMKFDTKRTVDDVIEEMKITQVHMDELVKELEELEK